MQNSTDKNITIREITADDNLTIESIIRRAMTEFNADPKTTIIGDPALKTMFENFQKPRAIYFIAEVDGVTAGGCGIAPLNGSEESICELQRMFLDQQFRGNGVGKQLIELCILKARDYGYTKMYLETLSGMNAAFSLYIKYGFEKIKEPLGQTGHTGCNIFMMLEL